MDAFPAPPRKRWRSRWEEEKNTVVVQVKVPARRERVPIKMDANDNVLKLKEKILEQERMHEVPVDRVVLQSRTTRFELLDHKLLKDCVVYDYPDNRIDMYLKPPPPPPPPWAADAGNLTVTVLPRNSGERIEIEVNAEEKVTVLRERLEEIHERVRFRLPHRGHYIFLYKENAMVETRSFLWHKVQHGDIICTFDEEYMKEYDHVPEDED
ncbi:uncharacterized protein LOC109812954 [Cajanus cajan]|uniref:Ubiquitin-like domain-containing protein n=1 Tax=Cajanus cajan TaxID=3821 RepID=A0A151U708_CAJCA|nr:uncharacterized protein LOC109812954 [Cajanus cajan]KYP75079.1 hypothetical protein KK1_007777 [Cajanus cajan]